MGELSAILIVVVLLIIVTVVRAQLKGSTPESFSGKNPEAEKEMVNVTEVRNALRMLHIDPPPSYKSAYGTLKKVAAGSSSSSTSEALAEVQRFYDDVRALRIGPAFPPVVQSILGDE